MSEPEIKCNQQWTATEEFLSCLEKLKTQHIQFEDCKSDKKLSELFKSKILPLIELSKDVDFSNIKSMEQHRSLYRFFSFAIGLCTVSYTDFEEINREWDDIIGYCFDSMKQFYLKCYKTDESDLCFEWYLAYARFLQLRGPEFLGDAIENYKISFDKYDALSIKENKSVRDKNRLEMCKRARDIAKHQAELILDYWQKYSKYEKTWKLHCGYCIFRDAGWTQSNEIIVKLKNRWQENHPNEKLGDCIVL